MTSNFSQKMVNQNQEIIFEVVKVSGSWVFPAASSIVEATKGKNMYLRLTDDGKSDIFRLDYVKDGENAGETVFGFVGNGGMDLVELTATTDSAGVTTGSWDYEPGEGPAGEAIGNLGQPLQWKGPATVAQLNAGITGIQPGWTYTLTDAGTLTDGSVEVEAGDEVAWTENDEWFKVGGDSGKVEVFRSFYTEGAWQWPSYSAISAAYGEGKTYCIVRTNPAGAVDVYWLKGKTTGQNIYFRFEGINGHYVDIKSDNSVSGGVLYDDQLDADSTNAVQNKVIYAAIGDVESKIGSVKNGGALTSAASVDVLNNACSTLATSEAALTLNVNVDVNEIPNFAVEITAGANITLTVTKTVGDTTTTLNYSAAAGNTLESGKLYQVTCVGSCWTLAEFTVPTP